MIYAFENEAWVEESFQGSDFGDKRLSSRLQTIANKMSERPESSIPLQMGNWNDIKSCYNFLNNENVTHKRIQEPHRRMVKAQASGKITLFIQDTSEVDYTNLESAEGLGYIGNHNNKGLLFHSCLAVVPDKENPKVLGVAHQQIWTRKSPSLNKKETRAQRNNRASKESDVWLKNLKTIGSPSEGSIWVSVGDRGNDIFEFFAGAEELGWESVVRASQDRLVVVDGEEASLMSHARSLKRRGSKVMGIRMRNETKSREIKLEIGWGEVEVQPPARLGKMDGLQVSVIRCWNEEEGLEWILYSSISVEALDEAIEKINWYANRWIIEEYHKCLKTGCRIQSSQLESARGLKALIGVLGIIAVLMLQLRNIARDNPDKPACKEVSQEALGIICKRFNLPLGINIRLFWHSVARLGGFIGRKSDGEPGWQTLWRGWLRLLDMMWGLNTAENGRSN